MLQVPTRLIFGAGSLSRAAEVIRPLGQRVLLVTGRSAMDSAGISGRLIDDLTRQSLSVLRFSDFRNGPTTDDTDRGVEFARSGKVDVIVALGGGSALDCGKAIAGVMSADASAEEVLHGRAPVTERVPPVVCIPSTAGTGSELNRSAILTDPKIPFKDGIRSDRLFPRYAIVDPELTWTVPRQMTAETGFDVLAHAIESYVSPKATRHCDALAVQAMRLVRGWLPIAMDEPDNRVARERLAWASTTMGINLARVGTCFPHRADKSLCAMRPEIPHGQSVALFYPYWLKLCQPAATDRFAEIARIMNPSLERLAPAEAAHLCCDEVVQFLLSLGLKVNLRQLGVEETDLPQLIRGVAGDLTVNPVPLAREDLPKIFRQILNGHFS